MFQFTPVLRRATRTRVDLAQVIAVSIHARLATGDPQARRGGQRSRRFNSRPSCDGRLYGVIPEAVVVVSIHARLATGDASRASISSMSSVSIHARLATGDASSRPTFRTSSCFNSRPSCDGRHHTRVSFTDETFQFTPVLRRATDAVCSGVMWKMWFQFTPVLRRATGGLGAQYTVRKFQFTPVLRRATASISPGYRW